MINMGEENISQEFRLKNIEEIKNYFIKLVNQNKLVSKKHKKVCTVWNYIKHLLTLASVNTGYVFISVFVSFVGISIGVTSSEVGAKICVITAEIKNYK